MKKIISLALILMLVVLVAAVSGCGGKKEEGKSAGPKTVRLCRDVADRPPSDESNRTGQKRC